MIDQLWILQRKCWNPPPQALLKKGFCDGVNWCISAEINTIDYEYFDYTNEEIWNNNGSMDWAHRIEDTMKDNKL